MATQSIKIKVVLVGDPGVGKAGIVSRYVSKDNSSYLPTVGIDFVSKTIYRDDKVFRLQIWDTAGQERFRSLLKSYYRGAKGVIIVFDVADRSSFQNVREWFQSIRTQADEYESCQVILVGNSCHTTDHRMITKKEAQELAQSLDLEYFETSVEDYINVSEIFERLLDKITSAECSLSESGPSIEKPLVDRP